MKENEIIDIGNKNSIALELLNKSNDVTSILKLEIENKNNEINILKEKEKKLEIELIEQNKSCSYLNNQVNGLSSKVVDLEKTHLSALKEKENENDILKNQINSLNSKVSELESNHISTLKEKRKRK